MTAYNKICELFTSKFLQNFSAPLPINVTIGLKEQSNSRMSITMTDVHATLHEMPNSAAGLDGILAVVDKQMVHILAAPLCHIYHQSLHQGILPNAWKIARVIPLYKGKGSKEEASSCRPISLTMLVCELC